MDLRTDDPVSKLDLILAELKEIKQEMKENRLSNKLMNDKLLKVELRVDNHDGIIKWIAGICTAIMTTVLGALSLSFFLDRMK